MCHTPILSVETISRMAVAQRVAVAAPLHETREDIDAYTYIHLSSLERPSRMVVAQRVAVLAPLHETREDIDTYIHTFILSGETISEGCDSACRCSCSTT